MLCAVAGRVQRSNVPTIEIPTFQVKSSVLCIGNSFGPLVNSILQYKASLHYKALVGVVVAILREMRDASGRMRAACEMLLGTCILSSGGWTMNTTPFFHSCMKRLVFMVTFPKAGSASRTRSPTMLFTTTK